MPAPSVSRHSPIQAQVHRTLMHGAPAYDVDASSVTRASPRKAWRVLTDYERLPEFVPDLVALTVLSRTRHEAVIEQRSNTGFLFLSLPVRMRLRIVEQPFARIDVSLLAGDMKHYAAHWELEPVSRQGRDGTHIRFAGTLQPAFFLPPLVGVALVQANVAKMVAAVVARIERRDTH